MDLEEYCAFKRRKVAKMFHRTDRNHNKKVDYNDLMHKMKDIIGHRVLSIEAYPMVRKYDKDHNGLDKDGEYDVTCSYGTVCLTSRVLIPGCI